MFDKLKTEHYVLIAIVVIVVLLLFTYGSREGYSSVRGFPNIPPSYWDPIKVTFWDPWFFTENAYDTVVPKVSRVNNALDQTVRKVRTEGFGPVGPLNLTTIVVILLLVAIVYHLSTHERV